MNRTTRIAPVEAEPLSQDTAHGQVSDAPVFAEEQWIEDQDEALSPRNRWGWIVPFLAVLVVAGWTGFFGWVHQERMLAGAAADTWAGWLTDWAVPVLLVIALWLLAMRNSRRETARFADAGRLLALESARLEDRLITVNRELSLARDFITAQSRDLESFGRMASERLSEHAENLRDLVQDNSAQVDAIATVSTTALENMDKLRNDLPVIANSARDTANQIGNAGRTAHAQLETMIEGMDRLNQFGKASEQQVQLVRHRVEDALSAFEEQANALEKLAEGHFAALSSHSETFKAMLAGQEVESLAAIRHRAEVLFSELQQSRDALADQEAGSLDLLRNRIVMLREEGSLAAQSLSEGEERALGAARERIDELTARISQFEAALQERDRLFHEHIEARRQEASARDEEELAGIEQRLGRFDEQVAKLHAAQQHNHVDLTRQAEELATRLAELQAEMAGVVAQGGATGNELAENIRRLSDAVAQSRQSLEGTGQQVATLTDASVRLLELIHASAQHSQDALPAALDDAEHKLVEFRRQTEALGEVLEQASVKGEQLATQVSGARREGQSVIEEFETFYGKLMGRNREHIARLADLRSELSALSAEKEARVGQARKSLEEAIATLKQSTREVLDELASGTDRVVATLTSELSARSGDTIDRIMESHATVAVGKLEAAAAQAAALGREAAVQLRDQLSRVDELASNLEARVTHARQKAEEQVDNDFARRVALITESLNSNAIDIAKALSNEVTDIAWASYLKGDRGVFTRRAVKLMENSESREIAEIYQNDDDFREHVSRYVHDFEAMMRTLLSTRDGYALSVTLLSSDMGKLYVVLAQAIDRLRN